MQIEIASLLIILHFENIIKLVYFLKEEVVGWNVKNTVAIENIRFSTWIRHGPR